MSSNIKNQRNTLTICAWNLNGLFSKCSTKQGDPAFRKCITEADIVGLVETHGDDSSLISLPGYSVHQVNRPQHYKATKSTGGLAILIRLELRKGISIVPNPSIQWIRLNKQFFKQDKDLYIAFVHIPPCNSTYTQKADEDPFDALQKDVDCFSRKGKIVICGDQNARTGTLPDFVPHDDLDLNTGA